MEFELNGRLLKYENGDIYIWRNTGNWRNNHKWEVISICNHNNNYKCCRIGNKMYQYHRILGMLFLGLDINDTKQLIDHIDGNPSNNEISNLRIVTNQQNDWNRIKAKGYYKHKNGFQAQININGKQTYLGRFNTEEEAKQAYLTAKSVYHQIN